MPIIKNLVNAGRVLTGQAPKCSICGSRMVKNVDEDLEFPVWKCPKCE